MKGGVRALGRAAVLLALAVGCGRDSRESVAVVASAEVERAAVDRGLAYLRRNRGNLAATSDLSALVVLDYLQRAYSLPGDLAFEATYDGAAHRDTLRVWGRFVGDDAPVDEAALGSLQGNPGIEEVVVHALHCRAFPPPPEYADVLQRFAERGGYELTHAALSLALLRENGCTQSAAALPRDIDARLRLRMRALLDQRAADPRYEELDVRYEALAFLQAFSGDRSLPNAPFARLLAEQREDGGWRAEADHASRMHPTVLAVWALLARLHPDAPRATFARSSRAH